ncbi:hypothetical protein RvY_15759-2 [Ramazzottius varieornatus]|uniref:Uncharacterized protein n=1 Tax=Ramazzottius varieornatus TaxID=947166 RepID=A0A1D1W2S5_RAMVA|nr:hypothetical protein RvY_15759-2 [Ramazzottius varieornatus]
MVSERHNEQEKAWKEPIPDQEKKASSHDLEGTVALRWIAKAWQVRRTLQPGHLYREEHGRIDWFWLRWGQVRADGAPFQSSSAWLEGVARTIPSLDGHLLRIRASSSFYWCHD